MINVKPSLMKYGPMMSLNGIVVSVIRELVFFGMPYAAATLRKELLVVHSSWRAARSCSFIHIFPPEAILHDAK